MYTLKKNNLKISDISYYKKISQIENNKTKLHFMFCTKSISFVLYYSRHV